MWRMEHTRENWRSCFRIAITGISLCLLVFIFVVVCKDYANDPQTLASDVTVRAQSGPRHYEYAISVVGKTFNVSPSVLEAMEFPIPQSQLLPLSNMTVMDFVVVTAASDKFFGGIVRLILSMRKYLPMHKIIMYDLGLKDHKVKELESACQVTVKKFDWKKYPEYVRNLHTYAFKPLVIHEVLKDFPGVLWLDSSGRILSSSWESPWSQLIRTQGILTLSTTGHSNWAVTHPGMFQYLPSNVTKLRQTEQREANALLFYRTHHVYMHVIKWWVLCALDNNCMAPILKLDCKWETNDRFNEHGNCHRFDQAAINILLANLYAFDATSYFYAGDPVVSIRRRQAKPAQELEKC